MAVQKYIPDFIKFAFANSKPLELSLSQITDTDNFLSTSFLYEHQNSPLKSTQQLDLDWSKFENHTFFMSAQAKVNLAFEQICNHYPFDGTREEFEKFIDGLTGYDKYVLEQFPKYSGQLLFQSGSYIQVKDYAGAMYPEFSKDKSGQSVINPQNANTSISFEMQLFISTGSLHNQIVFQKQNTNLNEGYTFHIRSSSYISDTTNAEFSIYSGSYRFSVQCPIVKNEFNHIYIAINKELQNYNAIELWNNCELYDSKTINTFGKLNIDIDDFLIGSGSTFTTETDVITPLDTLYATLDEFRIFHSLRSVTQLKNYEKKNIFATDDLKLYYKFNEPQPPIGPGNDSVNAIVLDSSGNSLHSTIQNFFSNDNAIYQSGIISESLLRQNSSLDQHSNVTNERYLSNVILFPYNQDVSNLNIELMTSASLYDDANPNMISKLVPQHYLLEGAYKSGKSDALDGNGDLYSGEGIPGQGKMSSVQIMLSFLYIWAKYFDELKLFADKFNSLNFVDYDKNSSIPSNFLQWYANSSGITLPSIFNNSTTDQFLFSENVDEDYGNYEQSIKSIQNELMRRILTNLPSIVRSKGTQYCIKTFLRSIGIDPDNTLRIKEYGGETSGEISRSRELKTVQVAMTDFISGSLMMGPSLIGKKVEPGWPYDTQIAENLTSNGMYTSGSWCLEGLFSINSVENNQSIVRLQSSGSSNVEILHSNLVYNVNDDTINLYIKSAYSQNADMLTLTLSAPVGETFNDGKIWNYAFGLVRSDEANLPIQSSSVYLKLGNQSGGDIEHLLLISSSFDEYPYDDTQYISSSFRKLDSEKNADGIHIRIGNEYIVEMSGGTNLNDANLSQDVRTSEFIGRQGNIRFWSKTVDDNEFIEHIRNPLSFGVNDPNINWNYNTTSSGSFQKLRLNTLCNQDVKNSIGGNITFLDFSETAGPSYGIGFSDMNDVLIADIMYQNIVSPSFDEAINGSRIRIMGTIEENINEPWALPAPIYETALNEAIKDDPRLSIDFSLIDSLNRDIINIFSSLDYFDNALGAPENLYNSEYPMIENLRDIYFNRIKDRLKFKEFFEFYKWFDETVGNFINQLIPKKTTYNGIRFVVESHMLERNRIAYTSNEMYLSENERSDIKSAIQVIEIGNDTL